MSNEEKTNDYENFEKGMIYMKILKKGGGVVEKRGEEETKSMPHAPVPSIKTTLGLSLVYFKRSYTYTYSSFSHDFLSDFNISITTAATSGARTVHVILPENLSSDESFQTEFHRAARHVTGCTWWIKGVAGL